MKKRHRTNNVTGAKALSPRASLTLNQGGKILGEPGRVNQIKAFAKNQAKAVGIEKALTISDPRVPPGVQNLKNTALSPQKTKKYRTRKNN